MEKENKFNSRLSDEKKEGEETLDSNVPGTRFQNKQQVEKPVKKVEQVAVESNPFSPKKIETKGSQLKQEQVARVITGTGGSVPAEGMSSPSRAGLRTLAYSGNEGTILGNPSGTPVVGTPSRSDTRPGQKLDAVAKEIDYLASEQAVIDVEGSKPLQDNPGSTVGFLGHPENISARIQKVSEAVPGALLYARSCDEIRRDEIAFVEGQMIKENGIDYRVDPTKTYDIKLGQYKAYSVKRGNYIPKTMNIGLRNGKVVAINFDVDDVNVTANADIVNKASSSYIRAMNQDEINRQNMEAIAGIETEKNWCPIVRAVEEPTPTVGRCTDDEITTASEEFMAYRFINKSLAYLFNKASKDGQTPYRSFYEALKGNAFKAQSSAAFDSFTSGFAVQDYLNGAPSLMIALYDSIAKYSKRGDLLVQPRSWKMHKQTADNNINMFRLYPDFAKYVINRDVFSTIDRGYDPFLPVCISDNWRLSHVLNFNELMNFGEAQKFDLKLGGKGMTTAGTALNNIVADGTAYATFNDFQAVKAVATARLAGYASAAVQSGDIYDYFGLKGSCDFGEPLVFVAKTNISAQNYGFETKDEGLAAAEELFAYIISKGANAQLHPYVILFKVYDATADDVYALCYYPLITKVTTIPNVKLLIKRGTTADYMSSDTSENTVLHDLVKYECDQFVYKYQNRQNPYITTVKNPLLFGIKEWAENLAGKLWDPAHSNGTSAASSYRDSQDMLWYKIPIVHSTTAVSLWDLIVCASVPFAQKIRTNSQFDTLNFEDANGKYPYQQLTPISEANPLAAINYAMTDLLHPLKVGTMKPAVALSWIIPEKFWRISHTVTEGVMTSEKFVLPFYFSEEQFKFTTSVGITTAVRANEGFVFNYPSTRAGARLGYLDDFYGLEERDVRLALDMMVDIPGTLDGITHPVVCGVYKYGLSNSGVPVAEYVTASQLTCCAYLRTPRELGLGMVAPYGYNKPGLARHTGSGTYATHDLYSDLDDLLSEGTSYEIKTWHVQGGSYTTLHDPINLKINRGGNFAQDWAVRADAIYADADNTSVEVYGTLDAKVNIGIAINFNDIMEVSSDGMAGESGSSRFYPFTDGENHNNTNLPSVITIQNALWPRLQMMPFALSPFDQTPEGRLVSNAHVSVDMVADPYDFMYIFGFCGFKASDYREDLFNRIYEKQTLGWTYVTDPFVVASPVLK